MAEDIESAKHFVDFIQHLGCDLRKFIETLIASPATKEQHWSMLADKFRHQRCREIKGCSKLDCPAFASDDYRCWIQAGTMCGGAVQGTFASKYRTCFDCEVFHIISQDPLRALYENIDILIFHLQDRAEKLQNLAIRDHLTGLYNRHYFNEIIERETAAIERRSEPLSMIMLDMDNFKAINDTQGHLIGDELLVQAAELIKNSIRRSDIAFRYGGDEFLVLMPGSDCVVQQTIIKRISTAADAWNKRNADQWKCLLSFSMGCGTCLQAEDIHAALMEADKRMYVCKKEKSLSHRPITGKKTPE